MIPIKRAGWDPTCSVTVLQGQRGINKVSQIIVDCATVPSRVCAVAGGASSRGILPARCWGGHCKSHWSLGLRLGAVMGHMS